MAVPPVALEYSETVGGALHVGSGQPLFVNINFARVGNLLLRERLEEALRGQHLGRLFRRGRIGRIYIQISINGEMEKLEKAADKKEILRGHFTAHQITDVVAGRADCGGDFIMREAALGASLLEDIGEGLTLLL